MDPGNRENRCDAYQGQQAHRHPLFPLHPAEEYAHYGNGDVGQGGSEVGLRENHQHRYANDRRSFHEIGPGEFPVPQFGKIPCNCKNQN